MKRKLEFYDLKKDKAEICSCGKICLSKQDAGFKVKFLTKIKSRETYLRAYHCPLCNMWHLTKSQAYEENI